MMSQDESVAAAGRLIDGLLESSFAIFDREKVLDAGGFSNSEADLCIRLSNKGWKIISAWDDKPLIRFENGFYNEESGLRWMSDEAVMRVGWSVCDIAEFPPLYLTFDVICSSSKYYPNFPFNLRIYEGKEVIKEIRFEKSYQTANVEILLPSCVEPHVLRFCSDESYIPREIGINGDPRRLAVMMRNVKLKEKNIYKPKHAESPIRIIAFYLPQFHPIPENDKWWGEGFTDWDNVQKAEPLFDGHYQPHVPSDLGYYDLRNPDVRQAQAEMAKKYGIEGFCYWHYWFNGKRLLELPFNEVLELGKPDFPFCLAWANENWTRNWDGRKDLILQPQEYGGEADDIAHFKWLSRAFADPRYIKVEGRPLFLIYRPADLPNAESTIAIWRQLAKDCGLPAPYLVAIKISIDNTEEGYWLKKGFDAELLFQPSFGKLWDMYGAGKLPGVLNQYGDGNGEPGLILNYDDAWHAMAEMEGNYWRTVVPCWDNTPRRKFGAFILRDSTPKAYGEWLKLEIERASSRPPEQRIVFVNAWNEWGEGNHLEPDVRFGHAYLKATKRAIISVQTANLYSKGNLDDAVSLLEKHIATDQDDAQAHNDLGVIYCEKGEIEKARYHLEKSFALDETDETVLKNLADFYISLGQSEKAVKLIEDRHEASKYSGEKPEKLRIIAILAAFNEGDVIYHVIRDLVEQDIEVYLLNHHSTDNTVEQASKWLGKGLIGIELFPEQSGFDIPSDVFSLRYILMRKEQLVRQFGPGWYINADADEFRESPWPGLSLREGIERVDALGYNTINFAIFDFKPTDNSFVPGDDVRKYLTGYSAPAVSWDKMQARCWKYWGQDFQLWQTGGHLVQFEGRRIFPIPFILRHYPIRSQAHGESKVFNERKNRFDEKEKAANWHVQYDSLTKSKRNFLWDSSKLTQYDKHEVCRKIHKRFAGTELIRGEGEIKSAIVILAYNQLEDTKKCLESVRRYTNLPHEIVVVDNGSTDGTAEYLSELKDNWSSDNCRAIKIVRHEHNLGYATGNNSGIAISEGAYVVVLNNDTVVTPGWLERLVKCADSDPRIGVVGAVSNNISGYQRISNVNYNQVTLEGLEEFAQSWAALHDGQVKRVPRVVGFCMLIKREVIEIIGGFDPRFGLGNFEDDDFSLRVAIAGYQSVIAQDCFIHHTGSRTFTCQKIDHDALMKTNWEVFKAKWGLPAELPLGMTYNISSLVRQTFDPDQHYCPLEISKSPLVWFAAPEWEKHETWCPILLEYIRLKSKEDALLCMYAGPRTASDSNIAAQLVADFLTKLGINEDQCPEVEITDELPKNKNIQIILSGGRLDEFLRVRYPGQCICLSELRKAA
ncbi:MAG: glycoside hydrolase family 99-like domain-containing protein [Armatimonadota bacterium]|nr:glycoside hydrolase family 99-like domain-containing protein [Armatimonadota bacterium]